MRRVPIETLIVWHIVVQHAKVYILNAFTSNGSFFLPIGILHYASLVTFERVPSIRVYNIHEAAVVVLQSS